MDASLLRTYNRSRKFETKEFRSACYAPHVSLFFDTLGRVRACCVNRSFLFGNIAQRSLDEIWNGPGVAILRQALRKYDFSQGCEHCAWQIQAGKHSLQDGAAFAVHALKYDEFPAAQTGPHWPANMEFNLSNVCNLECVMCTGEFSSAIRGRREKLPPLPKPYGDRFFADLRKYLPHLKSTQFLGGEPFLVQEHFRVWEMLIEDGLTPQVLITTNGTQYNDRIARILDRLPVSFNMSVDSIRAETLEKIRLGIRFDEWLRNFERFHDYCQQRRTLMTFNFVLMRSNWAELGEFLQFADERRCGVAVTLAVDPPECSLYSLPDAELAAVVDALELEAERRTQALTLNHLVWERIVADLRGRLSQHQDGAAAFHPRILTQHFERTIAPSELPALVAAQQSLLHELPNANRPAENLDWFAADLDDWIVELDAQPTGFFAQLPRSCVGLHNTELFDLCKAAFGNQLRVLASDEGPQRTRRSLVFVDELGHETHFAALTVPRYDERGKLIGSQTYIAMTGSHAGQSTAAAGH